MTEQKIAPQLAEWAASLSSDRVPASARHAARRVLLDQIGIAFAGSTSIPSVDCRTLHAPGSPPATCWRCGAQDAAPDVALANRCRGDYLELAAGPECVASAVAAAEVADATLGALLDAIAIAASVEDYLRSWLHVGAERHGLHPPALLGGASSAIAAGRLLGLAPGALTRALSTALALAPQSPFAALSQGSSAKALYGGWSQMLGLHAALWADAGIGGPPSVLDGPRGVAQALLDEISPAPSFDPFDQDGWAVERVSFKPYPCSRACHAALTAVDRMEPFDWRDVRAIQVATYPYAVSLDQRTMGDTPISAQLSLRRTLALRLVLGSLTASSYTAANISDPAVVTLAKKIVVDVHARCAETSERVRLARVHVTLSDESDREVECEAKWGPADPATDHELRARFETFTGSLTTFDVWPRAETDRVRHILKETPGG